MNRASTLVLATLLAAAMPACAKRPPVTPVVAALTIPTPPARLLIPVELPEFVEAEPEPVVEQTPPAPPARVTRPVERTAVAPPPTPTVAPPMLRTTTTAPDALEQRVRTLLSLAEEKLKLVNFRALGASERAHYGQARDFIRMANDNLRIRNYVYAEQLATKANTVAGLLTKS